MNPITVTKIFSTLGNNSSLVPLGVKDVSNTLGMTTGSYITGNKVEGKDRFIDEFGTQIIWLLGIPFFNKIINKTVYKMAGFNPNIDTRILNNEKVFDSAKKHALPELKASFDKVKANSKTFKGLGLAKFIASTALTLASYSALTTFRHKHTEQNIIKELKKEEAQKQTKDEFVKKEATAFMSADNTKNKTEKQPSFGMNLSQFMFDPVKNTMIIDGGITTERLTESRNPQDFLGYVVKEGGFWMFMYFLTPMIQNHMEKKAAKSNRPIDMDIRILQDEEFQKAIKTGEIKKYLDKLPQEFSVYSHNLAQKGDSKEVLSAKEIARKDAEVEIYESLFKQEDNLFVKMAKKAGIIKTMDEKSENKLDNLARKYGLKSPNIPIEQQKIDTQHYINIEEIVALKGKMKTLYKKYESEGIKSEDFFKQIVKLKRGSIIKGIGASIAALGLVVPGIMVAMRYFGEGNKEFAVKKQIHEKLKQQNQLA